MCNYLVCTIHIVYANGALEYEIVCVYILKSLHELLSSYITCLQMWNRCVTPHDWMRLWFHCGTLELIFALVRMAFLSLEPHNPIIKFSSAAMWCLLDVIGALINHSHFKFISVETSWNVNYGYECRLKIDDSFVDISMMSSISHPSTTTQKIGK